MKVKKIKFTSNDLELITFKDQSQEKLKEVYDSLITNFGAIKGEVVQGLDQAYLDLVINGKRVTTSWDSTAGVIMQCPDPNLREEIYRWFSKEN